MFDFTKLILSSTELAGITTSDLPLNDLGPGGIESKSFEICDTFPNPSIKIMSFDFENNSQAIV